MAVWPPALEWLAAEPVFSVDDARFTWGDVLLAAELRGSLAELTERARQRLVASRALAEAGAAPEPDEVRAAAARFRYERDLLAAEELDAWLARWRLELSAWTGYLRRSLSLERTDGDQANAGEPAEAELSAAAAVDAICSGWLEREAARLAADAALAAADAGTSELDRRASLALIVAMAADARRELASAADIEREIGARTLEWTRIDTDQLECSDADVAREAALCVRVDGRSLADVASDIGEPVGHRALYLEEVEQERLNELLGAAPGELVGPVARNGSFLLVHVRSRTRPSTDDPELRQLAARYLVEHATRRALESRVRWA